MACHGGSLAPLEPRAAGLGGGWGEAVGFAGGYCTRAQLPAAGFGQAGDAFFFFFSDKKQEQLSGPPTFACCVLPTADSCGLLAILGLSGFEGGFRRGPAECLRWGCF